MNKYILTAVVLLASLVAAGSEAHWSVRIGGGRHWHGGHWHGGGWSHGGWNHGWHGGWNGGWHSGWRGGGWQSGIWNRRVVSVGVWQQPVWNVNVWRGGWGPSYYPSNVGYHGPAYHDSVPTYGGCGYFGSNSVIDQGYVFAPAPAVYAPARIAYGPDAMKEFMGVDRDFAKGPLVASRQPLIVSAPVAGGARVVADAPEKKQRIAAHPEARARAERFISVGDSQFGEQEYHSAAQRYREAVASAPDVADAHFRQGFAYIASNRFDLAARSFRRGLEIDPLWVNSSFRLDELYGRNRLAKDSHIEGLAQGALADRSNGDYLFLIGLMLHFDGQTERAKKFFAQAEKHALGDDAHIEAFLVPTAPAAEDAI